MSPSFDAKKYKALMDGLEAVEVRLNELLNDNDEFRFDSDYFSKYNLIITKQLLSVKHEKIGDFAFVTDGIHASIDFDPNSKINLISAKAPKSNTFDLSATGFISAKQHANNVRTALKVNDIILSTVGTIGNCAVVENKILPANCDRHVGIIRIDRDYLPHYVSTFLLSKYGIAQSMRHTTGNVQPNLFLYKIRNIIVPYISSNFQSHISRSVIRATHFADEAEKIYTSAERLLLRELGLTDFAPSEENITVKLLSESFGITGRLDAEYYQPKYEDYIQLIKNYSGGFDLLQTVCNLKDNNFMPEDAKEYKYIELADIGKSGNITGCTFAKGDELPSRARRKVNTNDVIISSIEGSLESCALITEDFDDALCSTGFYVTNSSFINSETLLILFKSEAMQNILKRSCSGTILTAINKIDFLQIPVPLIDKAVQKKIATLIGESFKLRRESEELLEEAKEMVEREIAHTA